MLSVFFETRFGVGAVDPDDIVETFSAYINNTAVGMLELGVLDCFGGGAAEQTENK